MACVRSQTETFPLTGGRIEYAVGNQDANTITKAMVKLAAVMQDCLWGHEVSITETALDRTTKARVGFLWDGTFLRLRGSISLATSMTLSKIPPISRT